MSIATQLQAYEDGLSDAYDMVAQRGGTIPAQKNMNNLDAAIATIPSGGGGGTGIPMETVTYNSVKNFVPKTGSFTFTVPSDTQRVADYSLAYAFYGTTATLTAVTPGLTSLTFPSSSWTAGNHSLYFACWDCLNLSSVDFGGLTTVEGYGMDSAFRYSSIPSVTMNSLTSVWGYGLERAFQQCNSLTSLSMSSLATIGSSYGYALYYLAAQCPNLTTVNLSSLTTIAASNAMYSAFVSDTGLTSVDLSNLTTVSGQNAMAYAFNGCTGLASIDLSKLTTLSGSSAMSGCFWSTGLTSVTFTRLSTLTGASALSNAFRECSSLTTLSFPALTQNSFGSNTNQFNSMLQNCSNVTVHFPAVVQSKIGSWSSVTSGFGGTNTTVLYDL